MDLQAVAPVADRTPAFKRGGWLLFWTSPRCPSLLPCLRSHPPSVCLDHNMGARIRHLRGPSQESITRMGLSTEVPLSAPSVLDAMLSVASCGKAHLDIGLGEGRGPKSRCLAQGNQAGAKARVSSKSKSCYKRNIVPARCRPDQAGCGALVGRCRPGAGRCAALQAVHPTRAATRRTRADACHAARLWARRQRIRRQHAHEPDRCAKALCRPLP